MTTIAYHHASKTVAYDSRMTSDGEIVTDNIEKSYVCKRGWKWFISGTTADMEAILDQFEEHKKTTTNFDFAAFVVKEGAVYLASTYDGIYKLSPVTFNDTMGSGRKWALAAMDFGKTARQAVEYAKTRDSNTGGKVNIFKFKG